MKKQMIRKISALCCLTLAVFMSPAKQMNARAAEVIATVQGNVMKGTNTEILKLDTKEGNMEIKLDGGTDVSDCKVLLPGNQISVSVSHGSDGYLHAVKIVSGLHSDTVSLDTSKSSTVTGTITEKSKDGVLYVDARCWWRTEPIRLPVCAVRTPICTPRRLRMHWVPVLAIPLQPRRPRP